MKTRNTNNTTHSRLIEDGSIDQFSVSRSAIALKGSLASTESIGAPITRRRLLLSAAAAYGTAGLGCGGGGDISGSLDTPSTPQPPDPAPTPGQTIENELTYSADWTSSLVPSLGALPTWSFGPGLGSGSAAPTVRDCWGYIRSCKLGEARFVGARRVENKIRYSGDLTFGPFWFSVGSALVQTLSSDSRNPDISGTFRTHRLSKSTQNSARVQTVGILPRSKHVFSVFAKSESAAKVFLQFYVSGGDILASASFDIVPGEWRRVQISGIPDGTSTYRVLISPGAFTDAAPGSILVCDPQLEDASGHPNDAASEFIGTDFPRQPVWFNGAAVDGVQYFSTLKGNTEVAGVVTEASGSPIPRSQLRGLQLEPQDVNLCTQSESFSTWSHVPADVILSPAVALSPRGDQSATRLAESSRTSTRTISFQFENIALSSAITISCFAKAETSSWLRLSLSMCDGSFFSLYFDIENGAVGTINAADGRPCWAHIEAWATNGTVAY